MGRMLDYVRDVKDCGDGTVKITYQKDGRYEFYDKHDIERVVPRDTFIAGKHLHVYLKDGK